MAKRIQKNLPLNYRQTLPVAFFVRDRVVTYWQVGGCMSSYPRIPAYNASLRKRGYVFNPSVPYSLKIFYRILDELIKLDKLSKLRYIYYI